MRAACSCRHPTSAAHCLAPARLGLPLRRTSAYMATHTRTLAPCGNVGDAVAANCWRQLTMQCTASMRQISRAPLSCLLCLAGTAAASATDSYNLATGELSLPTVVIGGATYSNMVVGIGAIISGPTGTTANGSVDSYDPRTNQLTIQTVTAGSNTYFNVIATVAAVVSSGGVTGADTYN